MSEENVDLVRQPLTLRALSHQSLEERFGSRFPAMAERVITFGGRLWHRLPPRSWLRRAILRRYVRLAFEAFNRNAYDAAMLFYHPEVEMIVPPVLAGLGYPPLIRGRQERIRLQRTWMAEWGAFRFEPEQVIDIGDDRVLVLGRATGLGLTSGASFDREWANLFTLSGGQAFREQPFFDHAEALEAAGLSE